jgi:hypothetical protein
MTSSAVGHWLNIAAKEPSVSSTTEGHVVCLAQVVREGVCIMFSYLHVLTDLQPPYSDDFTDLTTYKLIIIAHAPSTCGVPDLLLQSPLAVLDVYVGHQDAGDAPQWTQWSKSYVFFLHRISSFTEFFIQLADLKFNSDQVCDSTN